MTHDTGQNEQGSAPTPYGDAALPYYDAGWTGVFPLPSASKSPPPADRTGWDGADAPREQVEREAHDHRYGNVAIHIPTGVLVIDVDTYSGKAGEQTLAALLSRTGATLPPTWISTARLGSPSGHLWYRAELPAGRTWIGGLPGIELLHAGHRYAVVAPSVHPDLGTAYVWVHGDTGEVTDQFPKRDELPELPEAVALELSRPAFDTEKVDLGTDEGKRLFERWATAGTPCAHVASMLSRHTGRLGSGQARHDVGRNGQLALLRLGEEGHPGVAGALAEFEESWTQALAGDREGDAEWRRALTGAVQRIAASPTPAAQWGCDELVADPEKLPEGFWRGRKVLEHIRNAAWSYEIPPDAVVYAVLSRLSSMLSPNLTLDLGMGPASLNLFACIVGVSGSGKSEGVSLAKRLLPTPAYLLGDAYLSDVPPSTGEGMVEAYHGWVYPVDAPKNKDGTPKVSAKVKEQVRRHAFFVLDEGEQLTRVQQRSSSIIGATIRSMWQGKAVGQQNASYETTRRLDERSYACGMVLIFQRDTVLPVLDDAGPGTPQRFVFASTFNSPAPAEPVPYPGELDLALDDCDDPFEARPIEGVIDCDPSIKADARTARRARQAMAKGEVDDRDLDSHAYLTRGKLAALLAVLDGRRFVDLEDWRLAGLMWETSCAVRADLLAYGRQRAETERRARDDAHIARELRKSLAVADAPAKLTRIASRLARYVHEHGPTARSVLSKTVLKASERDLRDEALAYAVEHRWLVENERRVAPGESRPADEV